MSSSLHRISSRDVDKSLEIALIVIQLLSGLSTWELLCTLKFELGVWKSKQGCRAGIFVLYLACRYFSYVSIMSKMLYLTCLRYNIYKSLYYISEITYAVTLGCAYQILSISVIPIRNYSRITTVLLIAQAGLWGLVVAALAMLNSIWKATTIQLLLSVYLTVYSGFLLTATAFPFYFTRLSTPASGSVRSAMVNAPARLLLYFVVMFFMTLASMIVGMTAPSTDGYLVMTFCFTAYVLTVLCACRVYTEYIVQSDVCSLAHRVKQLITAAAHLAMATIEYRRSRNAESPSSSSPTSPSARTARPRRSEDNDIEMADLRPRRHTSTAAFSALLTSTGVPASPSPLMRLMEDGEGPPAAR